MQNVSLLLKTRYWPINSALHCLCPTITEPGEIPIPFGTRLYIIV
nr:MAG TPA: hypothetical protein [Caudoviricetes sp.]